VVIWIVLSLEGTCKAKLPEGVLMRLLQTRPAKRVTLWNDFIELMSWCYSSHRFSGKAYVRRRNYNANVSMCEGSFLDEFDSE
jgi:hypothetical protein